jgi:hypothetical protein
MKGKKNNGISIVIPCLNEEASIRQAIEKAEEGVKKIGIPFEIIVVDNGSSDRSAEIARSCGARVLFEPHKGYGAALRKGFNNAVYEILAMGDADLTYDFTKLNELAEPVLTGKADLVIGNRMRSIKPGAMPPLHRYLGNPILSLFLRIMFHSNAVHDAHCGMRVLTKKAYKDMRLVTTGMEFASEMVVRAIRCGIKIEERDIEYHPRIGASKLRSFRDGWRHLRFMLLHSPTTLLLVPGLIGWVAGFIISLPLAFGPIMIAGRAIDIHCMLLGGLLNIISIQIISIGLLAKAYGHLSGLYEDVIIAWMYRWFTFEKACIISGLVIIGGLALTGYVVWRWIAAGFGALNEYRLLFLALLCLVNGIQIGAASYLFSIMALPRHIENLPAQAEETGISDAPE